MISVDFEVMENDLPVWAVYKDPVDFPGRYVARLHVGRGVKILQTGNIIVSHDCKTITDVMASMGLYCMPPKEDDDTHIIETWF